MFGMLDYRAHKLYWLLTLPFAAVAKLSFYAVVFASIISAEYMSKQAAIKIIIAWVVMEALSALVFLVFWRLVFGAIKKLFFFFIDVIPAQGRDVDEGKELVLRGDLFLLEKKIENNIEDWTDEDTKQFVSLGSNWRARAFFGVRKRFTAGVNELKRIHQETGSEPRDLGLSRIESIRESLEGGHVTILEKLVVRQPFFNSIVGLILIVLSICYIGNDMR